MRDRGRIKAPSSDPIENLRTRLSEQDRKIDDLYRRIPTAQVVSPIGLETLQGATVFRDLAHGSQSITAQTFTQLTFAETSWNDGGYASNAYTVPRGGVYSLIVRARLPDNLTATFSWGLGVHTSIIDGPWFLWTDSSSASTLGSRTQRTSLQVIRHDEFSEGDVLKAYIYIDRSVSTDVLKSEFAIRFEGLAP